jgi:hypothetical protein
MHLDHRQWQRSGMTTGSRAKPASNLSNASNICTMHQISNVHHYLQDEELREAEEALQMEEAGDLKATKTCYDYLCLRSLCNMENEEL